MEDEMTLTPEAAAKLVEMLENPPEPTEKLREAFERHGVMNASQRMDWIRSILTR